MALKTQGTRLRVASTSGSPVNITGITAANPAVVTAVAHGLATGDVVIIRGIVGMVQLNDRAFVVDNLTANTFSLRGIDSTGFTAYTSGGTVARQTLIDVAETSQIAGFDGQATEVDTTHLRSTAKEYVLGLQDFGNVTLSMFTVSDAGQARLRALKAQGNAAAFAVTLSDNSVAAFMAFVRSFTFDVGGPDGTVQSQVQLRVTGEPAWFA
jgi:hypothetical protein